MCRESMVNLLENCRSPKQWKKNVNVTAHQCVVKLNNMRRTYKTQKRPGAQQKAWIFYPEMEKLFSHNPVIELGNVAEIDNKGCPP